MWIPLNFAALGVRHEKIRLSAFVFYWTPEGFHRCGFVVVFFGLCG